MLDRTNELMSLIESKELYRHYLMDIVESINDTLPKEPPDDVINIIATRFSRSLPQGYGRDEVDLTFLATKLFYRCKRLPCVTPIGNHYTGELN